MNTKALHLVNDTEATDIFEQALSLRAAQHPIPISNVETLRSFIARKGSSENDFVKVSYAEGDHICIDGKLVGDALSNDQLQYAHVPLGFIANGEVVVLKGAKATKQLGAGDFLGLFETADWLSTKQSRQIGDWTLVAHTEVEVLYFTQDLLSRGGVQYDELRTYLIELARADHVPKPLTSLPILDWVAEHTTRERLHDTVIIVHTHMLPNSFPLFRHLSSIVDFGKIYAVEKPYSTVKKTINELVWAGFEVVPVQMEAGMPYDFAVQRSVGVLWQKVLEDRKKTGFKNLLIVDDGADIWQSIPWDSLEGVHIAGVEQTQRGINRIVHSPFRLPPIVNVASSGVKKMVEAEFIGLSVFNKIKELGLFAPGKRIGILGFGSIGGAVSRALAAEGYTYRFYDPAYAPGAAAPAEAVPSIDTLLNESDIIIGTTGLDSLKGIPYERVMGHKVLISGSSANVEFSSLIKFAEPTNDPFGTISVSVHEGLTFEILNGGYPINFDRVKDSTPDEDIVLTRSMLYVGAMQAAILLQEGNEEQAIYNLDKLAQRRMLERWLRDKAAAGQPTHTSETDIDSILEYKSSEVGKDMPTVWRD